MERLNAKRERRLIDVSAIFSEVSTIYRQNVSFTAEVWKAIAGEEERSHVLDICRNSLVSRYKEISMYEFLFWAWLPLEPSTVERGLCALKVVFGEGDEGEPVVTIMGENEIEFI